MQETEIAGKVVSLPSCHEGDKAWVASMLYNITTRQHAGYCEVPPVQRYNMICDYSRIYSNELDKTGCESTARRAANIFLREKVEDYKRMIACDFVKRFINS